MFVLALTAVPATAQLPAAAGRTDYKIGPVDTAHGDREFHLLWPEGAPGALGSEPVDKPKITVYRAPAGKANGAAVVVCPGGTFSWGLFRAAPTQFSPDLKDVSVSGTFANVRDNRGVSHTVSVDAHWTGTGGIMTTVNGPGSKSKERSATATATIVFDGDTLVDGDASFPFPAPFIRVDTEK